MFLHGTHAFMGIISSPKRSILILKRSASFVRNHIERRIAILVVFFVIGLIFTAAHPGEPPGIGLIPRDRLAQAFIKPDRRFPTYLGLDLLTVERVAAVVARTILYVCEQSFGLTHCAEQALRHRKIF